MRKQTYISVKSLIGELKKADPEAVVLIQRDPEGNGIHHLQGELISTENDELVGGKKSITLVADYEYLND